MVALLEALLSILPTHLIEGKTIRPGHFDSFFLEVSSECTEKTEEFTSRHIGQAKIIFRPCKILKDAVKSARFEKETTK